MFRIGSEIGAVPSLRITAGSIGAHGMVRKQARNVGWHVRWSSEQAHWFDGKRCQAVSEAQPPELRGLEA
jgi:hypothetical protein